ncbi:MAG: hypothetical protein UT63_C0101G0003 [Candidatus Gottesmanbacteria bacterium GW2011_GWC2_39_8]|uniref:TrbC/VIRB2 family protein n=1 Tax=Candidatus Gottesmanbacteria bacterium GW2011_GWC2_39_8 TaxID=1618450 RepID=A0A0G0SXK9_9BACT|nr:MAG: hypothetical protein UT63_C0101G0003 [Candidatus Gottesmanbacteria bacterium GW2011_GWC2_39_8]
MKYSVEKIFISVLTVLSFVHLAKAATCETSNSSILCNPLKAESFTGFLEVVSKLAVEIGIPVAVLFIIYAGLKLVMARGNEDEIKKAKESLTWAIIGSGILIGAWTIMKILESTVKSLG